MPDSPPTCAGIEKRTGEIEREREKGGRREKERKEGGRGVERMMFFFLDGNKMSSLEINLSVTSAGTGGRVPLSRLGWDTDGTMALEPERATGTELPAETSQSGE